MPLKASRKAFNTLIHQFFFTASIISDCSALAVHFSHVITMHQFVTQVIFTLEWCCLKKCLLLLGFCYCFICFLTFSTLWIFISKRAANPKDKILANNNIAINGKRSKITIIIIEPSMMLPEFQPPCSILSFFSFTSLIPPLSCNSYLI